MKQNSKVIHEKYEFRNIHKDEIEQAAEKASVFRQMKRVLMNIWSHE